MMIFIILLLIVSGMILFRSMPTLSGQDTSESDCDASVQEMMLLGLCSLRSGIAETVIYHATMANLRQQAQGVLPTPDLRPAGIVMQDKNL